MTETQKNRVIEAREVEIERLKKKMRNIIEAQERRIKKDKPPDERLDRRWRELDGRCGQLEVLNRGRIVTARTPSRGPDSLSGRYSGLG